MFDLCTRQYSIPEATPVMTGTVIKDGQIVSRADDDSQATGILQFNVSKVSRIIDLQNASVEILVASTFARVIHRFMVGYRKCNVGEDESLRYEDAEWDARSILQPSD